MPKDYTDKDKKPEKPKERPVFKKTREQLEADDLRRRWREYEGDGGAY